MKKSLTFSGGIIPDDGPTGSYDLTLTGGVHTSVVDGIINNCAQLTEFVYGQTILVTPYFDWTEITNFSVEFWYNIVRQWRFL